MSRSLQSVIPAARHRTVRTRTWASAGNTDTVTDKDVKDNSIIVIMNTSARNGRWYVSSISNKTFTVSSSDVEDGSPTYSYEVI